MQKNSSASKLRPKKRFGQNFLVDEAIIDKIIDSAEISPGDTVLEIGPGRGALTGRLVKTGAGILAVEIDRDLAPLLRQQFFLYDNLTVVEGDILKTDLKELLGEYESLKIVANLPYYITTPIIMMLLEGGLSFDRIIVMVQREVSLRMCAGAGSPDYGALSLAVDYYTTPSLVTDVSRECFRPVPKVDSAVVKLLKKDPPCDDKVQKKLFSLIKASFSKRRKTLVNALSSEGIASKEEIQRALNTLGWDLNIRGEALSLEDFISFTNILL